MDAWMVEAKAHESAEKIGLKQSGGSLEFPTFSK